MAGPCSVVASDWLRPRLGATWRTGHVVGVTPRAAYVVVHPRATTLDGPPVPRRVLAVETADAVGLPNGVEVADPHVLARLAVGQPVTFAGAHITVGDVSLAVRRWRRSRPVPGRADRVVVRARLRSLGVTGARPVPAEWPDPDPHLVDGAARLATVVTVGDGPDGVEDVLARLLGYGPGSTPAGDDVVAAVVATASALAGRWEVPTPGLARLAAGATALAPARTTALSTTLLACAGDGAMARPAAAALVALTGTADLAGPSGVDPDPSTAAAALDGLARVGHTSGRDLALGLLAVTSALAARRADGHDPGVADRVGPGAPTPGHDAAHHLLSSSTHDRSS